MRLAIYSDFAYRREDGRLWAELPVVAFLAQLSEHVERVTLVGRLDPSPGRWRHEVPAAVDLVDAVWLLGPHPLAPPFAALAALRGRRVALGVRQDFPAYVRSRHPASR